MLLQQHWQRVGDFFVGSVVTIRHLARGATTPEDVCASRSTQFDQTMITNLNFASPGCVVAAPSRLEGEVAYLPSETFGPIGGLDIKDFERINDADWGRSCANDEIIVFRRISNDLNLKPSFSRKLSLLLQELCNNNVPGAPCFAIKMRCV